MNILCAEYHEWLDGLNEASINEREGVLTASNLAPSTPHMNGSTQDKGKPMTESHEQHFVRFPGAIVRTRAGRQFAVYEQAPTLRGTRYTVTGFNMTCDGIIDMMNTRIPLDDIECVVCEIDSAAILQRTIKFVDSVYATITRRLGKASA